MCMKYEEIEGNVKKIYSVHIDEGKLVEVLNRVCRETYYIDRDKEHCMPGMTEFEGNIITSGAKLPNGDPMFININKIYYKYNYGVYHECPLIDGDKKVVPFLAKILQALLANQEGSIEEFLEYKNSPNLIPIDEQISKLNDDINNCSNIDERICLEEKMKELCKEKEENHFFNAGLLNKLYKSAELAIEFNLEEKITQEQCNEKVLSKDFLGNK